MHKWRKRVVMSIQYYHDCINIEQLLVMDVQTGSTLTPSKNYSTHFHLLWVGVPAPGFLNVDFCPPPPYPLHCFKDVWINLCLIAISAKQPILTVHQMLVCLLESCGFIIYMLVGIKDISSNGLFIFFIKFKMKGEGLKLISKVYVYGSNCEFKWSGKYMKMLSLFVHVSVGDVLGLVRMEKW